MRDATELKTPSEWCKLLGVEILDPDGWRGSNGRPWTDSISLQEFEERLVVCTMRHVVQADERAEFKARRDAGLKARHEQRLENATYTAAEVKVLTEAALRLGRAEVLEERCRCFAGAEHTIGDHLDWTGASPQPSQDATSGQTPVTGTPSHPQDSQTATGGPNG